MAYEFREAFTLAIRQVVPMATSRHLHVSFDCEAAAGSVLAASERDVRGTVVRLFYAASHLLTSGTVHVTALTRRGRKGGKQEGDLAVMQFGGTGTSVSPKDMANVLQWLRLDGMQDAEQGLESSIQATGVCPVSGAKVQFDSMPGWGFLISAQLPAQLPAQSPPQAGEAALPNAKGAQVWLVASDEVRGRAWTRRFQRLGWHVQVFASYGDVARRLTDGLLAKEPKLVLGMADTHDTSSDMGKVAAALGGASRLIYVAEAGDPLLRDPMKVKGYEVVVFPLGPGALESITALAADEAEGAMTRLLPLLPSSANKALVVDDNELNVLVGRVFFEGLGYSVQTACDGVTAIKACQDDAPDIALINVNMPRLNGFEAAQTIRGLQNEGALQLFPMVGVTAAWSPSLRAEALAAGMDECIAIPLDFDALRLEINRFCTLC